MARSHSMTAFARQVFALVRRIPPGRVATYGGLAVHIPPPQGIDPLGYERVRARWVGDAMARCPNDVPWHRVVNARGQISPRPGFDPALQRHLLGLEGVVFGEDDCIDLGRFAWDRPTQASRRPAKPRGR